MPYADKKKQAEYLAAYRKSHVKKKRPYNREWMARWRAAGRDKSRKNYSGLAEGGT